MENQMTSFSIPSHQADTLPDCQRSDFFPVILNFLRQLPFIGNFLNLPVVRDVSTPSSLMPHFSPC